MIPIPCFYVILFRETTIEKNGGKIIRPKTKIEAEGRGYFSLFIDSEVLLDDLFYSE